MSLVEVAKSKPQFPWGERGQRPVRFSLGATATQQLLDAKIPGLVGDAGRGSVSCSWDLAPAIAKYTSLQAQLLKAAQDTNGFIPSNTAPMLYPEAGEAWWQKYGAPKARKHQIADVDFMTRRAWGYLANEMRCGKTFSAVSIAMRLAAQHVLCIVPARSKLGWAREIARVTGESSLILEGRGADEMRNICLSCSGRGYQIADDAKNTRKCPDCNGSGDKYYHVRNAGQYAPIEFDVESYLSPTDGNGDPWPDGQDHLLEITASLAPSLRYGCRDHRLPKQGGFNYCVACKAQFDSTLRNTRFVIANPEIFIKHRESTKTGQTVVRADLPGWGGTYGPIWMMPWDVVFIDEAHSMRARNYESFFETRTHRNDRIFDAIRDVPRVYALSGTPVYGCVADLYMQYNLISNGLFGDSNWNFDVRYTASWTKYDERLGMDVPTCTHPETKRWTPTGRTNLVESELVPRIRLFSRQVTLEEANPDLPPIEHENEYLENIDAERGARGLRLQKKEDVRKEVRRLSKLKHPFVVENVVSELLTERKSYCLVYNVVEAKQLAKAITNEIESRELVGRMRAVNAKVFLLTGETVTSAKVLEQICEDFRNHKGAAVIVATYHQTQGFISLNGARFVHCVDWFESAAGMQQSIRRAYELFSKALSVRYYTMRGTLDTRLERLVLPSLQAALAVAVKKSKELENMQATLQEAVSPGYELSQEIEGTSPVAAYVDAEGRLVLPLSGAQLDKNAAKATANTERVKANLFAELPEGMDEDIFKSILADAAEIDENDTRNYNWGPGGAGSGGAAAIDDGIDSDGDDEDDAIND